MASQVQQRFEITVADKEFGGVLSGVRFTDGVGHTDNPHAAFNCRQYGAVVVDTDPPKRASPVQS